MKFNVDLTAAEQEYLENQYKEYVKSKNMTSRERTALREWVADGNSVYNNPMGLWKDGFHPAEFLEVYRDEGLRFRCKNNVWSRLRGSPYEDVPGTCI